MTEKPNVNDLVIVTGAAGFIGRNVVAELNRRGNTNLILCDLLGTDDKWKNLRGLSFEDIFSPKDLLEKVEKGAFKEAKAILHLGACSATTEKNADFLLENNYRYTRRLCEFSLANRIRFIYASSAATYGDGSRGYSDDDAVTPTLRPLNMYGYSKHLFDLWAIQRDALKEIVGLKYFNVFGPFEDHKGDMKSVVAKAYSQIRNTGKVQLFKSYNPRFADGEQMRDFIYIKDVVGVTLSFLENRETAGLFNCGSGRARTWTELVTAVFNAMGAPANIEFIEMPENLRDKYQYFTEARMEKLEKAKHPLPIYSLEAAVTDYVENYLKKAERE
jgi:ADP-L-glycero-D-manno-heptose 6-epimerase